jgi:hypothetical protein
MHLAIVLRLGPLHSHLIAIVAMKGIPVDDCRPNTLAAKDLLKGRRHGRRART